MMSELPALQPLTLQENNPAQQRLRVLIADDHAPVLERVTSVLKEHFEVVGMANNGKELVQEAIRLQPDIIVSDILMPGCTGLEAAHRLREAGLTAKLIFLSVYEGGEFVKACFSEGGLAYVTKARLGTDLVHAINEVVNGRRFISPSIQDV